MTHRPVATAGGPTAGGEPLGPAVASFLAERDVAPSSRRVYVLALHRLLDRLGADTPLAKVSPRMLAEFMLPAQLRTAWSVVVICKASREKI